MTRIAEYEPERLFKTDQRLRQAGASGFGYARKAADKVKK
jgi:hypothetical protein